MKEKSAIILRHTSNKYVTDILTEDKSFLSFEDQLWKARIDNPNQLYFTKQEVYDLLPILLKYIEKNDITKKFSSGEALLELEQYISQIFNIPMGSIKLKTRKRNIVTARQLFFCLLVADKYGTYETIGELCSKDHATVFHSMRVINNLIDTEDKVYFLWISNIIKRYGFTSYFNL